MIYKKIEKIFQILFQTKWKEYRELKYWKGRKQKEGDLKNHHYEFFYTNLFGLETSDYEGKNVLDIGCGPRGSLEWINGNGRRIGLDPLANEYLKLGAEKHKMKYIKGTSEKIPFESEYFDIICTFNSLDHVEDITTSIREIKRSLKRSGILLIIVEANHKPTSTEPHSIIPTQLKNQLGPELILNFDKMYYHNEPGIYESILKDLTVHEKEMDKVNGIYVAKFQKK
jgi:ubiquinone/menaquinone biosynthesis C-methylase UbiE